MKKYWLVFLFAGALPIAGVAQTTSPQPLASRPDTVKSAPAKKDTVPFKLARPDSAKASVELELEAIAIEAIIEKPNVDIIPKRIVPELEEVEFVERNFERELKEVPKDLLLLDDDLDRVAKLEGIKKILEKKKKKQDK